MTSESSNVQDDEEYQYDLEGEINELFHKDEAYCITYYYGDGGAPVYVKRVSGDVDAKRAAIYCECKCEEWFGSDKMITNLGVGALLVTFYGFQHHSSGPYEKIDMYFDRSTYCGESYIKLITDENLHREKLREYMEPHVIA